MEKATWTTSMMAEALMVTTGRLSRWMTKYGIVAEEKIKGPNYKNIRLFTDRQFIDVMRAHTLASMGYSAQGIRNILEQKGNIMKIDRLRHPILTYGDMDAFVNQLTNLEMEELIKAMEHLVVSKNTLLQLRARLDEIEKKSDAVHEETTKNHRNTIDILNEIEEIKEKLNPLM